MPEAPINFPPEPVNKKDPPYIEVTGFGYGESNPITVKQKPAEAEDSAPPAKDTPPARK